jgi:hypothetical protein
MTGNSSMNLHGVSAVRIGNYHRHRLDGEGWQVVTLTTPDGQRFDVTLHLVDGCKGIARSDIHFCEHCNTPEVLASHGIEAAR